jgi:hypothetical protein
VEAELDIVGGILGGDADGSRIESRIAVVADEDSLVGRTVEGEGRIAKDFESSSIHKEKGFAAGKHDLADGRGEITRKVGSARVDLVVMEDRRVAEATGGTALVSFGEAFEEDGAEGTGMKHDKAGGWLLVKSS